MLFKRFLALCYDLFLLCCLWLIASLILVIALQGKPIPPNTLWYQLLLIAMAQAFFVGFWCYGRGQTIGLRAWRLRLVVNSGDLPQTLSPVPLRRALIYFWVGVLSLALGGIGWLFMRHSAEKHSWAERISGLKLVFITQTCYPAQDNLGPARP